jgi:sugar/nucleoside kinase (ribokinase family)
MPIEAQEVGAAAARAAGVPMSLDPHEEYVIGFERRLRSLAEGAVFLPSELEARLLFPDIAVADPVRFGLATAERLDAWRPSIIAVKLGDRGSVVRIDGRSTHIPALPTPVVDPTGAGDAYCGGFVVGWLVTHDAVVAAACGTVAAAETIGTFGAFGEGPRPTPKERLARVEEVVAAIAPSDAATTDFDAPLTLLRRHTIDERVGSHP